MKNRIISIALRVSVTLLLIVILLYIMRDRYGEILSALKGMNLRLFALALLLYAVAVVVASYRFKLIIDSQENIPVTFPEVISLSFIGYFFNNFLPTAIGGDVVKGYYLSKKTAHKIGSFTTVLVDRFMGLVTMIFMAFAALVFMQGAITDEGVRNKLYIITAAAAALVLIIAIKPVARKLSFLLVFLRPIEEKLKGLYNAIHHYRNHSTLLLKSMAISVGSQLIFYVAIGVLAWSINSRISIMDALLRIPIISLMSLLPSLNGFGPREFSTKLLFGPLIGDVNAVAVSILWDLMLLIFSVTGGLIYGLSPHFRVKMKAEPAV